jgi:hypothetical protein
MGYFSNSEFDGRLLGNLRKTAYSPEELNKFREMLKIVTEEQNDDDDDIGGYYLKGD